MKKALLIIFTFCSLVSVGQTYQLDKEKSSISIKGTSSMHDWESIAEAFELNYALDVPTGISLSVKGESIKSGKSIMDDKTYEALKTEDFPSITFKSSEVKELNSTVQARGNLRIAGVSKQVTLQAKKQQTPDGIQISGEYALQMTDYEITPPTAMFGSLKTGDEVTVVFNLFLKSNDNN